MLYRNIIKLDQQRKDARDIATRDIVGDHISTIQTHFLQE